MIYNTEAEQFYYIYQAKVIRWVDADTVDLVIDLGFKLTLGSDDKPVRFRLFAINAPEKYKEGGAEAITFVNELAPANSEVIIRTFKIKDDDNFGRYLVAIYLGEIEFVVVNGSTINDTLLSSGHAVPYEK